MKQCEHPEKKRRSLIEDHSYEICWCSGCGALGRRVFHWTGGSIFGCPGEWRRWTWEAPGTNGKQTETR